MKKITRTITAVLLTVTLMTATALVANATPVPTNTAVTKPAKPSITAIRNVTTKKITVKIKKVKNATGYQIAFKKGTKKYITAKTTKLSKSYAVSNSTECKVKVRAYRKTKKKIVYGKWSTVKTVKKYVPATTPKPVPATTKPVTSKLTVPSISVTSPSTGTVKVKILADVKNADGYEYAFRRCGYDENYTITKETNHIRVKLYTVNESTTCQVKVRAYKETADGTVYSSWSSVKSLSAQEIAATVAPYIGITDPTDPTVPSIEVTNPSNGIINVRITKEAENADGYAYGIHKYTIVDYYYPGTAHYDVIKSKDLTKSYTAKTDGTYWIAVCAYREDPEGTVYSGWSDAVSLEIECSEPTAKPYSTPSAAPTVAPTRTPVNTNTPAQSAKPTVTPSISETPSAHTHKWKPVCETRLDTRVYMKGYPYMDVTGWHQNWYNINTPGGIWDMDHSKYVITETADNSKMITVSSFNFDDNGMQFTSARDTVNESRNVKVVVSYKCVCGEVKDIDEDAPVGHVHRWKYTDDNWANTNYDEHTATCINRNCPYCGAYDRDCSTGNIIKESNRLMTWEDGHWFDHGETDETIYRCANCNHELTDDDLTKIKGCGKTMDAFELRAIINATAYSNEIMYDETKTMNEENNIHTHDYQPVYTNRTKITKSYDSRETIGYKSTQEEQEFMKNYPYYKLNTWDGWSASVVDNGFRLDDWDHKHNATYDVHNNLLTGNTGTWWSDWINVPNTDRPIRETIHHEAGTTEETLDHFECAKCGKTQEVNTYVRRIVE